MSDLHVITRRPEDGGQACTYVVRVSQITKTGEGLTLFAGHARLTIEIYIPDEVLDQLAYHRPHGRRLTRP